MNGKYYGRLEVRYHKKEAARLEHIKNKRKRSKTMVKGYKVFNPDWTCKGKQYTCPGTFEEDVNPSICNVGMMNNRVRDLQETALFEMLASKDPELKAMLDEYKTLRGC